MDQPPPRPPILDYRMSLAAERTYLAYVRTALALLAGRLNLRVLVRLWCRYPDTTA